MSFIDTLEKIKIKIFAPATVCYRRLGHFQSEFRYWAGLPCCAIFKDEPIDENGYYKTVYINNKRVKKYTIIPRNALIEVREKPHIIGAIFSTIMAAIVIHTSIIGMAAAVIAGVATAAIVGGAAVAGIALLKSLSKKSSSNSSGTPTYASNDNPSLSGCKNEILENCVPIVFGRIKQTFSYGQYTIPLVKSGFGGNRYQTYSIASYANATYSDFKIGDVAINEYRPTAYNLIYKQDDDFIGFDNATTESFSDKELSFDRTQEILQTSLVYYNEVITGTSAKVKQTFTFTNADTTNWVNKELDVNLTFLDNYNETQVATGSLTITKDDLSSTGTTGEYTATKTTTINLTGMTVTEALTVETEPTSDTRATKDTTTLIEVTTETLYIGDTTYEKTVNQGVNNYAGDRSEIISQSLTQTKYCDIHFSFPQGLYKLTSSAKRKSATIQAEIYWKPVGGTTWLTTSDSGISRVYTRNIDGEIEDLSSRITKGTDGKTFTFKSPTKIADANNKFFECVGLEFAQSGQYLVKIMPVAFNKTDKFIGTINISEVVWRLEDGIDVVNKDMLKNVFQVKCTFSATTQLDGEVDELNAICEPRILNLETNNIETSRNPVDIIYHLLTDTNSNPNPMTTDQIDLDSFKVARTWCAEHDCKCDGIISEDTKYETIINDICDNNQLYLIPNKWGKVVLRVDTNEDGRPVKALFNAENSWDLEITRIRGRLGRTMALRFSFTDEETWSDNEITGYWYNGQCNWEPEEGKDDTYYQTEKRDINYIVNADNIKRRIAYELEIANSKNVKATFKVAREVLDLEVLDRVYVADYTRIKDGLSGTISGLITENGNIVGVETNAPFIVKDGMTMTIRSVDVSGNGENISIYSLKTNDSYSSKIYFETPIASADSKLRTAGFYTVDGQEFYYSGDLFTAGTAELLSMVISEIEEVSGDDFTSKITCRSY